MTPPDAAIICWLFGLGEPVAPAQPLTGQSSAAVWALDTVDGAWVVKAIRPEGEWQLAAMRRAGRLELAAHEAGVSMPRPVVPPAAGSENIPVGLWSPLPEGGGYARVSERASGAPPPVPADAHLADWLGRTVAAIARLGLPGDVTEESAYDVHGLADWARWLDEARRAGLVDAHERATLYAAVADATDVMHAGRAGAPAFLLAHRDISPANVLVTARGPMLLDFDHAGPEVAWWELVHHTFLFACRRLGEDPPVPAAVRTAVQAYASAGAEVGVADATAFAGLLRGMLEWTAFSLWLALGHRPVPGAGARSAQRRREAASAYAREAARVMPIIVDALDDWSGLLR